ncbi:translation initiation factor IF-2 [Catalinimonas alkaloidigena]|uniref:translation initiation factor IF-2 n=1 Tax=Catalinimonas alkaloidigena TaxID=1075417 RepID=UPI0024070F4E|nr:translation initiation factor IF-2 [Catalinimonas alkaloidigena]MDF9800210.1 translation initiation factor IF-2 [Catalinimonas alkaloidigena]
MVEEKMMRLSQVARKLNVGLSTITEHLANKGFEVDNKPNAKIPIEQFNMLAKEFASSALDKEEASGLTIGNKHSENMIIDSSKKEKQKDQDEEELFIKGLSESQEEGDAKEDEPKVDNKKQETAKKEDEPEKVSNRLQGIKVVGKIDLDSLNRKKPAAKKEEEKKAEDKKAEDRKPTQPEAEKKEAEKKPAPQPKAEDTTHTPQAQEEKETSTPQAKKEELKKEEPKEVKKEIQAEAEQAEAEEKPEVKDTQKEEPKEKEETAKPAAEAKEKEPQEESSAADSSEKETQKEIQKTEAKKPEEKGKADKGEDSKTDRVNTRADQLKGLTVVGKIDLPEERKKKAKPVASSDEGGNKKKRKRRRRIKSQDEKSGADNRERGGRAPASGKGSAPGGKGGDKRGRGGKKRPKKEEPSEKEIQEQIKETLAKLSGGGKKGKASRNRQERRRADRREREQQAAEQEQDMKLKVTEFISANDLASMMDVSVNEVISTCMSLGMFVSINQRLDAETITVIADEFGYDVDFTDTEDEISVEVEEDEDVDMKDRAPIVTIMGHVDHGKTSLLDYIRSAKVTEGEAGGITQHIGAYDVTTESGKRVAFLDTPGHEAFTAMRARGASVTDVVIVVVAADDNVMPQTKEAINHAQVAGVPIVIAINKIDKPNANPDKVREELANINILVEDWGGKYQCQEISAKTGQGIDDLLEKVLLEAELLELKANPDKRAVGTVIEATLDRGRGYVTTLLVQAGDLKIGDVILAGAHYGKVKAMFDHRGNKLTKAGPSTPVQMLGLDGAPQAGDKFNVMESDREAREIANKREQIHREQSLRTKKHITLDEIGRRLAIGSFKELNIIVKGDVDGSVEALSDSMLKLSTEEVQVNIIHKAVGQISESDVLLASASDAIIVGFQVRPSASARNLAEKEEIEIRLYSIIYDAINEIKDAMEGMLAPTVEEIITGNIEVRRIFKISKVGTVAGCYVTDGVVKRNNQIRLIRDGIVAYTGEINQLKREKDDVNEVRSGYECGISIKNYNDIKEGDIIEGFEEKEVKRSL